MQVKREEQHNLKQVNRTEDSQFMDERFDAKEEGKNSYHGNHSKRKKKAETPDGKVRSKNQPGSFDINYSFDNYDWKFFCSGEGHQ